MGLSARPQANRTTLPALGAGGPPAGRRRHRRAPRRCSGGRRTAAKCCGWPRQPSCRRPSGRPLMRWRNSVDGPSDSVCALLEDAHLTGAAAATLLGLPLLSPPAGLPIAVRPGDPHIGHDRTPYGRIRHGHLPLVHRTMRARVRTVSAAYAAVDLRPPSRSTRWACHCRCRITAWRRTRRHVCIDQQNAGLPGDQYGSLGRRARRRAQRKPAGNPRPTCLYRSRSAGAHFECVDSRSRAVVQVGSSRPRHRGAAGSRWRGQVQRPGRRE